MYKVIDRLTGAVVSKAISRAEAIRCCMDWAIRANSWTRYEVVSC